MKKYQYLKLKVSETNLSFGLKTKQGAKLQKLQDKMFNKNLDFTRALHTVVGYDITFKKDVRIKVEAYYQKLDNIPIDTNASSYSVINEGSSFDRFFPNKLVNIELTIKQPVRML